MLCSFVPICLSQSKFKIMIITTIIIIIIIICLIHGSRINFKLFIFFGIWRIIEKRLFSNKNAAKINKDISFLFTWDLSLFRCWDFILSAFSPTNTQVSSSNHTYLFLYKYLYILCILKWLIWILCQYLIKI